MQVNTALHTGSCLRCLPRPIVIIVIHIHVNSRFGFPTTRPRAESSGCMHGSLDLWATGELVDALAWPQALIV